MNIETGVSDKRSGEAPPQIRHAGSQLGLPLEVDFRDEQALRAAWTRCSLRMPYQVAPQNRPLAICLGCHADAMPIKAYMEGYGATGKRRSNRTSRQQHS
jgi:hypothetical protein